MTFSPTFLALIVHGALLWCAISAVALGLMIARDMARGESW